MMFVYNGFADYNYLCIIIWEHTICLIVTSFICFLGLCGNFDGDKDNDLVTKGGKVVNKKQPDEFSAEWRSVKLARTQF